MIFADLFFIYIFLPLNIILYYLSKSNAYRNFVLVGFSLFFYAWGEPVMVLLMIFTATMNCVLGIIIEDSKSKSAKQVALIMSIAISIGLFILFKYTGFIVQNINFLLNISLPIPKISLPIGISFYTFQALSYVVDVYRGDVKAQRSPFKFLMYISLYTQLVAGPIVRYSDVANEVDTRNENFPDLSGGLTRFCIGLSKKVIIANNAGILATPLLDGDISKLSTVGAWFGITLFTLQIYYDFSGYSDMAIGLGRVFGFHFPENFIYPYTARSATEFWRKWHISLGGFFRDYLYIPLGGNRRHWARNLLITWCATGLWHGASWNFVLWGFYFGVLIFLERLFINDLLNALPKFFSHFYLIFAVLMGWVLFYFTDISRVSLYYKALFGLNGVGLYTTEEFILIANNIWWFLVAIIFCAPIAERINRELGHLRETSLGEAIGIVAQPVFNITLLMTCTSLLVGQSYNPFLYYKF